MITENKLSKDELIKLYNSDLDDLLKLSSKYIKDTVEFCSIVNARNGKCSQNCKYCAQSSHYRTNIETYPLIPVDDVIKAAEESKENKASRFAIVTSGKTPDEEDFNKVLELIKAINNIDGIKSCASIGILNEEQAKALSDAGLKRFHHNINTSESYYPEVCTTHTWQDRLNTCRLVKKYGMELCCGVILGMGESIEQRIEMAMELAEIEPESIPINILMPIPETPFENYIDKKGLREEMKEALAHFHLENAFRRIYWKRFADIRKEMKRLVNEMESYPCLINNLSKRERKIVNAYRVSGFWGDLKLRYYNMRHKL